MSSTSSRQEVEEKGKERDEKYLEGDHGLLEPRVHAIEVGFARLKLDQVAELLEDGGDERESTTRVALCERIRQTEQLRSLKKIEKK